MHTTFRPCHFLFNFIILAFVLYCFRSVTSRPVTSFGHQRRVFWEWPKFFKLWPTHFPGDKKHLVTGLVISGLWRPSHRYFATQLLSQWILHWWRASGSTIRLAWTVSLHSSSSPSTRLDRAQVPFFKSSVRPGGEPRFGGVCSTNCITYQVSALF